MPPATLTISKGQNGKSCDLRKSLRYAPALARTPGMSATVLEALAMIDGTPVNTSAGKVRNIPPPATELINPAASAAMMSKKYEAMSTPNFQTYHYFALGFATNRATHFRQPHVLD